MLVLQSSNQIFTLFFMTVIRHWNEVAAVQCASGDGDIFQSQKSSSGDLMKPEQT